MQCCHIQTLLSLALVLAWGLVSVLQAASVLQTTANAMAPGQWTELVTNQLLDVWGADPANGYISQYADELSWDPVTKQIFFCGSSHSASSIGRCGKYIESTNTWTVLPGPSNNSHAYEHHAVVPAHGKYYYRGYYSGLVQVYDIAANSWNSTLPSFSSNVQVAGVLEYFAARDSLIMVDGDWGVFEYSFGTGSWVFRGSTNSGGQYPMGSYSNVGKYNPLRRSMIFGGGGPCLYVSPCSNRLYKMTATGTIMRMRDAPMNMAISHPMATLITVDPVSGHFLIFMTTDGSTARFYDYDDTTDTWRQITTSTQLAPFFSTHGPDGPLHGVLATPISTYGVVLFVMGQSGYQRTWLYRHTPSTPVPPDTIPPVAPPGLQAQ